MSEFLVVQLSFMALKQIACTQSEQQIIIKLGSGLEFSLYEIAFLEKLCCSVQAVFIFNVHPKVILKFRFMHIGTAYITHSLKQCQNFGPKLHVMYIKTCKKDCKGKRMRKQMAACVCAHVNVPCSFVTNHSSIFKVYFDILIKFLDLIKITGSI